MASIKKQVLSKGVVYRLNGIVSDPLTGIKKRKSKNWTVPKGMSEKEAEAEAKRLAIELEESMKDNLEYGLEDSDYTVEQYSKIYIHYLKKSFSPTNAVRTSEIFEYINKKIGNVKLSKLNPAFIQNYFDEVDDDKRLVEQCIPKKCFNEILKEYGYNYHSLRYEVKIQHATLSRAIKGENVTLGWAETLCKKTSIPFDELFSYKRVSKDYSFETKKKRKTYLRQMLAYAKRQRVIRENYATADYVVYTRDDNLTQINAMDEEQAKKFYETLLNYPDIRIRTSMLIFLMCGFRRGEVAALTWEDINFETKRITISRAATIVTGLGVIIKEPKTKKSARSITMPQILFEHLVEYKAWYDITSKDFKSTSKVTKWLFTQKDGSMIDPGTFLIWMYKVLDKAELPKFTIHSLRHTNITLQIAAGVPLVTVSGRAGHSRTSTTTDIYSHFIQTSDGVAAKAIDKVFDEDENDSGTLSDLKEYIKIKSKMNELGINSIEELLKLIK